ncbi:TetR/AcrR family transcriptional regulator [Pseudohoeflea coraliihabitans]|uniref:TetR/AcrR family transcriptional regulator n=1 Tax=Pseudohoeflea coraliihabitans TaxID=2860393 RepID=A0ABS6WN51_9HYPH|nr:TetR/AcrR family transcriptional regulator [Pseudohoeflea sp. DP4N28-3]MBW3097315.1 TetR/AcrR family transcriptional regulator [Pseudohoeflea sp. DP4N28-3]
MDAPAMGHGNPKVLDILHAAKSVFARKGFDGASMQDLAQAAQMSVGNFYRYFPSKNAIIQALVQRDLEDMQAEFEQIRTSPDPRAEFLARLRNRLEHLSMEDAALWTEIQAASFRFPEIAELKHEMEETIRGHIVAALQRIENGAGEADPARYDRHAHLIMLMVHGFAQRRFCSRALEDEAATKALADLVLSTLRLAFEHSANGARAQ